MCVGTGADAWHPCSRALCLPNDAPIRQQPPEASGQLQHQTCGVDPAQANTDLISWWLAICLPVIRAAARAHCCLL
jgi:hypothetical protein